MPGIVGIGGSDGSAVGNPIGSAVGIWIVNGVMTIDCPSGVDASTRVVGRPGGFGIVVASSATVAGALVDVADPVFVS